MDDRTLEGCIGIARNPYVSQETRDQGLKLALSVADDDLADLEAYFDARQDADGDSEGFWPNEAMNLLAAVRRVRELHQRISRNHDLNLCGVERSAP